MQLARSNSRRLSWHQSDILCLSLCVLCCAGWQKQQQHVVQRSTQEVWVVGWARRESAGDRAGVSKASLLRWCCVSVFQHCVFFLRPTCMLAGLDSRRTVYMWRCSRHCRVCDKDAACAPK
jgi:hypothetical protein